ncbi:hypothetical protein JXB28_00725 [Candidatus Woesearchaeota archaeon]|nr:hypothetical protein [Candidatus Woesearchaeota archaeon]
MEKFAPRRYFKNTIIFYVICGLLLIAGIIVASGFMDRFPGSSTGKIEVTSFQMGLIMIGFSSLIIIIMLFNNLALGSYYSVGAEGITAAKGGSKQVFSFTEILDLKKVGASEAEQLMGSYDQPQPFSSPSDIGEAMKSAYDSTKLIRFCTVPIVFSGREPATRVAQTGGDFILLTTTSGDKYLLSPKDVDGFVRKISSFRTFSQPAVPVNGLPA